MNTTVDEYSSAEEFMIGRLDEINQSYGHLYLLWKVSVRSTTGVTLHHEVAYTSRYLSSVELEPIVKDPNMVQHHPTTVGVYEPFREFSVGTGYNSYCLSGVHENHLFICCMHDNTVEIPTDMLIKSIMQYSIPCISYRVLPDIDIICT